MDPEPPNPQEALLEPGRHSKSLPKPLEASPKSAKVTYCRLGVPSEPALILDPRGSKEYIVSEFQVFWPKSAHRKSLASTKIGYRSLKAHVYSRLPKRAKGSEYLTATERIQDQSIRSNMPTMPQGLIEYGLEAQQPDKMRPQSLRVSAQVLAPLGPCPKPLFETGPTCCQSATLRLLNPGLYAVNLTLPPQHRNLLPIGRDFRVFACCHLHWQLLPCGFGNGFGLGSLSPLNPFF